MTGRKKKTPQVEGVAIPHVMITASAGSGKTWQLTNRMLSLILAGAPPESIIALTFTRKAAGEFFDAVLGRLALAAHDPAAADQLCRDLRLAARPPGGFLPPLRALISQLHRLQFTTIDSFFHRIVGTFPFELGLSGAFSLMDEYQAGQARVQVLEQILRRGTPGSGETARRNFLQNFKQATYGTEAKSPADSLDKYVRDLHALFQEIPEVVRWGGPALPAPVRAWVDAAGGGELPSDLGEHIRRGLAASGAKEPGLEAWDVWGADLLGWKPTTAIGTSTYKTIRTNILGSYDPVVRVCGEFNLARGKIRPTAALARDLGMLVEKWLARELRHQVELTQGVGKILEGYDALYDRMVRRSGRLVFSDLPRVIGPVFQGDGVRVDRLDLDYRLDARFDHWLLDEFQDTSRIQWKVLENLIDEVVQDAEGGRSFFCVGDVKQSIYAWRGGDYRLFGELRQRYGDHIGNESLVETYRCSGAVVDLVNRVMGGGAVAELLPGAAAWSGVWQEHQSKRPGTGFAAYLEAPEQAEEDEMDPRHWMIGRLIQQIDPPGRGLTCAVLTYSNKEARAVADFLRAATPYPVILEGEIRPAEDNMLGRLALAWIMALAHPQDRLADGWLQASPIRHLFVESEWRWEAWKKIHRVGFEAALMEVFSQLEELSALDAFHGLRRRQILDAVRDFESGGSRDAGALATYLQARTLKAPQVPGAIEVMTIYKAKGLGFDLVFVTELLRTNKPMNKHRQGPMIGRDGAREPQWLLFPPTKLMAGLVPELQETMDEAVRENVYEQLCLLYVALTRAKEALYLVGHGKLSRGESISPQHLLQKALVDPEGDRADLVPPLDLDDSGEVAARAYFGDPLWFQKSKQRAVEEHPVTDWMFDFPASSSSPEESATQVPSARGGQKPAWQESLTPARRKAREKGNRVHALLARVGDADELETVVSQGRWEAVDVAEVRACLKVAGIRALFATGRGVEVWRERAFQAVVGTRWIRGVFDRVVIHRAADGSVERAVLVDFKTDVVAVPRDTEEEATAAEAAWMDRYRGQMEDYRDALAVLLAVDKVRITGCLMAVEWRRLVWVF